MGVITSQEAQAPRTQVSHAQLIAEVPKQHMFAQLTALSPDISRLSPADADVFRNAFQREEICYANSWLYLLRSTRDDQGGFGYKFVGNETLMGIGYRNNTLYLVHPIGNGRFTATRDLVCELRSRIQSPIILKKIDQELYEYLSSTNLFQANADGSTLFEEEAFPEHILSLPHLYSSDVGLYCQSSPFIRKVRQFEKSSMKLLAKTDISDIESHPGFHRLFGPNPDKYKSYLQIIREAISQRPSDGTYKVCVYYDEDAIIHGLYISELLEERRMGLYCAVSSKSSRGITEWMDYDFFQQLFHDGIDALYLGGSETPGVHAYVKKLFPIVPPYLMRPMEMYCHNEELPCLNGNVAD